MSNEYLDWLIAVEDIARLITKQSDLRIGTRNKMLRRLYCQQVNPIHIPDSVYWELALS